MQPEHCDSSTLTTGASAVPPRPERGASKLGQTLQGFLALRGDFGHLRAVLLQRAAGEQHTGLFRNDDADPGTGLHFLNRLQRAAHVEGLDLGDVRNADAADHALDVQMVAALAEDGGAHAGIGLMAGHGGRAIVEDHQQHVVSC